MPYASDTPPALARRRSARWLEAITLLLIAAIAVVIYGWIAIGGLGIISFSDSADYIFFADFYRGQLVGDVPPEALAYYWKTRFPPLFPLLLGVLGGGTHDLPHTQVIACAITFGMFAALWLWLRRETGSALTAAAITLLVVLSPGLFLLTLNPVSEPLAMGMTWLAFLLASRSGRTTDGFLLVALVAGLSALARSINIALVLAIPIWLLLQRAKPKQWIAGTVVAFLPFVAWSFYRRTIPRTTTYTDGLDLNFIVRELGGWPDLLYLHPWRLATGFAKNFDTTPDVVSLSIAIAILVFAVVGWWQRARDRKLDAVFLLIYVAVILVWPYPREAMRFMTFIVPLLLFHAVVGFDQSIGALNSRARALPATPLGLVAMVLLASAGTIYHFIHLAAVDLGPELRGEQREQTYFYSKDRQSAVRTAEGFARIRLAARESVRNLPPGECIYAVMPYLLERHGPVHTQPSPLHLDPARDIRAQLPDCNYLFVVGMRGAWPEQIPFYPLDLVRDLTIGVVVAETAPGSMVAALLTWAGNRENVAEPGASINAPIRSTELPPDN